LCGEKAKHLETHLCSCIYEYLEVVLIWTTKIAAFLFCYLFLCSLFLHFPCNEWLVDYV
jgi:hypothetical protein